MVDLNIELPEGFLDEEVRCGYTVTRQMKEVWAVELDLAKKLIDVCEKNNIKLMAFAGTTLGAVRHKGFIPWDDDIDFIMTRSEYDKLCEIASTEFTEPYFFQTEYTDPGTIRGHAQLRNSKTTAILKAEEEGKYSFNQGIFIDIFPVDNIPDDETAFQQMKRKAGVYQKIYLKIVCYSNKYSVYKGRNFLKKFLKPVIHSVMIAFNRSNTLEQYFYKKYEMVMSSYNGVKTKKCGLLTFLPEESRFYFSPEALEEVIKVPFEFLQFPISSKYEEQLVNAYGDYMKFVIGSSVHGGVIFDTERSYTEYIKNTGKKSV